MRAWKAFMELRRQQRAGLAGALRIVEAADDQHTLAHALQAWQARVAAQLQVSQLCCCHRSTDALQTLHVWTVPVLANGCLATCQQP